MMETDQAWTLGILVGAFLLGSIPFGLLMARIFKAGDLREQGSGNIGATNVSRVAGFWPAGFLTFLLDALKGALPPAFVLAPFVRDLIPDMPALGIGLAWAAGLCAILGHCFSPWLRFKGGKGVATGLGAIAVLTPIAALVGVIGFVFVFIDRRVGSLASLSGLTLAAVAHLVLHTAEPYHWFGALMILVIVVRHEPNMDAILDNREKSFR